MSFANSSAPRCSSQSAIILSLSISTSIPCNHHALVRGNALLFEGVCIAHRQCLPPLCKRPLPEVASLFDHSSMRGAERRWKFERCRSLCLRGRLAGCEDPLQAHRSQPSLENETLSSFAILISRRPTSISVAGQPTVNVTPRSRHHDIGLSSISSGAVSPARTDDSSTRLYASRGSSSAHLVSPSTSRAAGHSVTDDDQRLAHG